MRSPVTIPELVFEIGAYISDADLFSVVRVNRLWYHLLFPRLYISVDKDQLDRIPNYFFARNAHHVQKNSVDVRWSDSLSFILDLTKVAVNNYNNKSSGSNLQSLELFVDYRDLVFPQTLALISHHLSLNNTALKDKDMDELFNLGPKLKKLSLKRCKFKWPPTAAWSSSSISTSTTTVDSPQFPNLEFLSIDNDHLDQSGSNIELQLSASQSLFHRAFRSYFPSHPVWSQLHSLTLSSTHSELSDSLIASILDQCTESLTKLVLCDTPFWYRSLVSLERHHFGCLVHLDLYGCPCLRSWMIQRILHRCSQLVFFRSSILNACEIVNGPESEKVRARQMARDIEMDQMQSRIELQQEQEREPVNQNILDYHATQVARDLSRPVRRPWRCLEPQHLIVGIDQIMCGWDNQIFERLAKLTRLQTLDLGFHSTPHMSSTIQLNDTDADVMNPPPGASMQQWDFNHLPLAEQLEALGDDAAPPSLSPAYFLHKWALELPDAPCLLVPNASATAYITFSYAQYDTATDYIARHWASKLNPAWLDDGRTRTMAKRGDPVALLVKDSPTSHFLMIAFQKLRIPLLLVSTRNSPAAVSHLVTTCKVSAILVEDSLRSLLETQTAHIPTYSVSPINPDELLQVRSVKPIPHYADVNADDVSAIVHSSGTTSFPKLVPTPYRTVYYSGLCLDITGGYYGRRKRSAVLLAIPLFHTAGLRITMTTLTGAQALVLPLSTTWPASAAQIAASLNQSKARILVTVPAIVEQLMSNTNTHTALAGLHLLYCGGAPLSLETFQLLRKQMGIKLVNMYGSSEIGVSMMSCINGDHGDCDSRGDELLIGPLTHAKMVQVDEDLYELSVHRDSPFMAINMPTDEQGWYHSGDLFRHRGKEHYILIGRKDDTLVHVNGEKTAALPMENCLVGVERVILRALVVGANRPCTAALIELNPEVAASMSQQEINTRIAHAVAQANIAAPQHSQLLFPDM
ncbi:hypothetical protein BGZ83_001456, partial [Gryganskiella cystojenkinii]